MKKAIFAVIFCLMLVGVNFAEETPAPQAHNINVYTFFFNAVSPNFNFPLIGFVNFAAGSHSMPQIGFFNYNENDFSSVQIGFVNVTGGNFDGLQTGFVNTTMGSFNGLQLGFVNTTIHSFSGLQTGFVNTVTGDSMRGFQLGFVNTALNGFNGAQIAFVNLASKINGFQLGFINIADSIENGIPFGFISIVRNGGYRAIELSVNEISPLNLTFKIGVNKLYTLFRASWNPFIDELDEAMSFGAGIGSILSINDNFFFNPELLSSSILGFNNQFLNFTANFGFRIGSGTSIVAGPSVTWQYIGRSGELLEPFFSLHKFDLNERNNLFIGARLALKFQW
ncbi:MAG: hypothetical protein FWC97_08940 [Treponema sp.]|nr:hypothetical protein [Treponema sp.]